MLISKKIHSKALASTLGIVAVRSLDPKTLLSLAEMAIWNSRDSISGMNTYLRMSSCWKMLRKT
jgi:hypothetical protein